MQRTISAAPDTFTIDGQRIFVPYLHTPGGFWMSADADPYECETFSFHHYGTGALMHFHVHRLRLLILAGAAPFDRTASVETPLTEKDVDFVLRKHGIEEAGLRRMSPVKLDTPGLLAELEDGTGIIVDGNHRYVARWRAGLRSMRFLALTEAQWRLSLLNIPAEYGRLMTGEAAQTQGVSQ